VIEVIGVPFDLCGKRMGSRLGPSAVRLAGLRQALEALGNGLADLGDVSNGLPYQEANPEVRWGAAVDCLCLARAAVAHSLDKGHLPLVIGGEHTMSVGAIGAALDRFGDELAVLWIDAHADLNTPATSPSKNLHGMPLAALMGFPSGASGPLHDVWTRIQGEATPGRRLQANRTAWLGLRDVDPGERERIAQIEGGFMATMYDIDRFGLVEALDRFDAWMRSVGASRLWISFDVDVLDPILAPGTGTTVRGGLSYREMHLSGERLNELMAEPSCPYKLAGLDVMEINPLYDTNNETARTAVEWIASLFGKTILGKR
jgi:arginase